MLFFFFISFTFLYNFVFNDKLKKILIYHIFIPNKNMIFTLYDNLQTK